MSTPQKPGPPREGTSRAGCANRVYLRSPLAPNASPATKKRQTDKHQKRQKRAEQKAAAQQVAQQAAQLLAEQVAQQVAEQATQKNTKKKKKKEKTRREKKEKKARKAARAATRAAEQEQVQAELRVQAEQAQVQAELRVQAELWEQAELRVQAELQAEQVRWHLSLGRDWAAATTVDMERRTAPENTNPEEVSGDLDPSAPVAPAAPAAPAAPVATRLGNTSLTFTGTVAKLLGPDLDTDLAWLNSNQLI